MEAPQNRRLYGKMECLPPWAHLNRWEGEDFEYCVGEFVCDKISFFCDFFGKKTLGKYVFGYKKIVVNEQICFCHFCEMDQKKGTCQPSSNANGKTGAQKSLWIPDLVQLSIKRRREKRETHMFH
jgi:hypothetical protein